MNPELKAMMDAEGNWITVQMIRTRSGKGWIEKPVLSSSDRAVEPRKAA
ncbi:hypothetical protein [Devosia aurantiaca]|uniref:Uncharacterized protein n=1 Tax=Devosia aurantiaca TaxID=2714858 RepID=A0A6M1SH47_9HYPH|nr:hypothetical protein [Devosia aurantiaca]NGP19159.1 hypothetical protein [Devosia aurantiaca]